ncbi:hypothetical protein PINS_up000120 [Pythium insidiosum]|nr:hypothetical protein PINS_up000120 [Pythium insidiosum]
MPLTQLSDELLTGVVGFLPPRDVEACAVASRVIAIDVLPRFPIWRELFCRRWEALNFALRSASDGRVRLMIDRRLRALFPSDCSESRMFQILTHATTRVPSFLDVGATQRAAAAEWTQHRIESMSSADERPCSVAFAGRSAGGNRMVRANVPFDASRFRVAVMATAYDSFVVSLVAGGYVELSRSRRASSSRNASSHSVGSRSSTREMVAIGVATHQSRLTQNQPGWDGFSLGLHSDDGGIYSRAVRRRLGGLSMPCGTRDTLGCGVRRDLDARRSFVFFSHNSKAVSGESLSTIEVPHKPWFPVVGLDTDDVVHVNFGQRPFVYSDALESLLEECNGRRDLIERLPWCSDLDLDVAIGASATEVIPTERTTTAVVWDAWNVENSALVSLLVASEQGNFGSLLRRENWVYAAEVVTAMAQHVLQSVKAGTKGLLTQRVLH